MKIAVLIPCYNVEKYLAECLDSVLAAGAQLSTFNLQPSTSLSIFCCDDGSKDGTLKILKDYAAHHPEVHYVTQPNAGVSAARNRLLDELPSEFDAFAFVDADDTVQPEYFARLEEAMTRTGSDVAEYAADLVEKETLVDDTSVLWLKRTNPGVRSAIVGKLISRSVAGVVRLRPELKYEEDLMYSYEVNAVIHRKVILPGFPYNYQYNPNSATQNINWRKYVESACRRVELFQAEFLDKGLVPPSLLAEFIRELNKDAVRMCIVKNLKKNPDPVLRRELFFSASDFLTSSRIPRPHSSSLLFWACRKRHYQLARMLACLV